MKFRNDNFSTEVYDNFHILPILPKVINKKRPSITYFNDYQTEVKETTTYLNLTFIIESFIIQYFFFKTEQTKQMKIKAFRNFYDHFYEENNERK